MVVSCKTTQPPSSHHTNSSDKGGDVMNGNNGGGGRAQQLGMATGRDGFRCLIPIPVKKFYPHNHTQTQWVTGIISYLYPYPFP